MHALTKRHARRLAGGVRRIDPVWVGVAGVYGALAAAAPHQFPETARFTAASLLGLLPVLVLATALAAALLASGADGAVARALAGRRRTSVALASGIGALSPLCGVEVLPVVAALLAGGVPLAPVMAFWLASPITDPAMLLVTAWALGLEFAVAKTLIAALLGLGGGALTTWLEQAGLLRDALRGRAAPAAGCGVGVGALDTAPVAWRFWREPGRRVRFVREARSAAGLMLKWLTLAFTAESLMLAWLPPEALAGWLSGGTLRAVLLAAVVGAPVYLNGYAALPLADGLMELGMNPGAAMAFLVAGGVTSLPAAIAVYALVSRPVFLCYLMLAVAGAILGGLGFALYTAATGA